MTGVMMHTWQWQTWQNLPYLTCSLLHPWPHGFFTQHFWPHLPETLVDGLSKNAAVYRVKQVHGGTVLLPPEIEQGTTRSAVQDDAGEVVQAVNRPEADALITEQTQQSVWVCTADCNPVLIADAGTGKVAAIHAGWRGTALKVVPATITRMLTLGCQIQNLRVAMGPAIAGEVYQVSTHVAAEVGRTIAPEQATLEDEALVAWLQAQPHPAILPDATAGRARLDVRRINEMQLDHLGLTPAQVAIAPHCTYQEPERFFSYRRTKEKKVQWSGIVST
jgi:hypothetical protein